MRRQRRASAQCLVCQRGLQGKQEKFCSAACRKRALAEAVRARRKQGHVHQFQCPWGALLRLGRPSKYP